MLKDSAKRPKTPEKFYAYLNRAAFTKAADAKRYLIEQRDTFMAWEIDAENDEGEVEAILNPRIPKYGTALAVAGDEADCYRVVMRRAYPTDDDYTMEHEGRETPERQLLFLKIRGESHDTIAKLMHLPSAATVDKRLQRMRNKAGIRKCSELDAPVIEDEDNYAPGEQDQDTQRYRWDYEGEAA